MEQFEQMNMVELEEHYRQLEQQIQQMNMEDMTEQDRQALKEHQEIQKFYTDVAESLAFVSQSAGVVMENGDTEIKSIMPQEQYGELLSTLSNGSDRNFMELVLAEKVSDSTFSERQEELKLMEKIPETVIEKNPELQEQTAQLSENLYTVEEMKNAVEVTGQIMQEYSIDNKDDILLQTQEVFQELNSDDKLITLEKQESPEAELTALLEEEQYENEKPVVITESSDGYIMNTSKALSSGNVEQAVTEDGRKAPIENGNEIHHEVAQETTNDLSEVSPVVHLEESGGVSTLETELGITEESKKNKEDMER